MQTCRGFIFVEMFKKTLIFISLIVFSALVGKGWHWAKDGFNVHRIRPALIAAVKDSMPPQFEPVLNQPFFYLGKGRQFYSFASRDGKTVLKFPRFNSYELPLWLQMIPSAWMKDYRLQIAKKRAERLEFLLESSRLAFEEIKDQTVLLGLHFYQTRGRHPLKICDRFGREYQIDLDRVPFVLQEKKELMEEAFSKALAKEDRDEAQTILKGLLKVVAERSKKGIINKDHSLLANYGFDGKNGFEIDIGSFARPKEGSSKKAFRDTIDPILNWLQHLDPELADWMQSETDLFLRDLAG